MANQGKDGRWDASAMRENPGWAVGVTGLVLLAFANTGDDLEATGGAERGSWVPAKAANCKTGGHACTTALAVLCLRVPMAEN